MTEIYTTGKVLKKYNACEPNFTNLIKSIPNYEPTTKISIIYIIKTNGIIDGIWALRAIIGVKKKRKITLEFAIACAEHVLPLYEEKYPTDDCPHKAIEAAKNVLKNDTKQNRAIAYASAARASAYAPAAAVAYVSADASDYASAADTCVHVADNGKQEREWQQKKLLEILNKGF